MPTMLTENSLPLIGISGSTKSAGALCLEPSVLRDLPVDYFLCGYPRAVLAAGGLPVLMSSHVDPAEYAHRLDGLLLTGGPDIEPAQYGQVPCAELDDPSSARDLFEFGLLDAAVESQIPVLGICRGAQIINVHAGGTLHQHLPDHACFDQPVNELSHTVDLVDGSVLRSMYGASLQVNSLHHQAVDRTGEQLRVTARTEDGTVEGVEHESLTWVGIQWHPEMLDRRDQDPVFLWLIETAAARN